MTGERWKQIKTIYQEAVETAPDKRLQFLKNSCLRDEELKREVESLLQFESAANDFIEEPAFDVVAGLLADADYSPSGKQIDNYRIIREIGRGGMGSVYLAERCDGLFAQRVAVKLIKRGMDSDQILKRFSMERQILAGLEHPNIARLIGGGVTEDGSPYLVMEYVEGDSVKRFCESPNFDTRECLEIFLKICEAVEYAHRQSIVHRDLKPSNILVNENGEPKLLDFGVAKILQPTNKDEHTLTTQLPMITPEYASPEQLRGAAVTTATDIYSLGVLLYELLTGERPFNFQTFQSREAIARLICETHPKRPSSIVSVSRASRRSASGSETNSSQSKWTIGEQNPKHLILNPKSIKGDLDNIILTAMRKEPERRYASVEEFAADIRRYLQGFPVRASRDSTAYRFNKFVRRNRIAASAAAVALFAVLTGTGLTVWQTSRVSAEQTQRFSQIRQVAASLVSDADNDLSKLLGATDLRLKKLREALAYLEKLRDENPEDAELQNELALAFLKIGDVQGKPYAANVGDTEAARQSYEKALVVLERLTETEPQTDEYKLNLSSAYEALGNIELRLAKAESGIDYHRKSLVLREEIYNRRPDNQRLGLVADSQFNLADALRTKSGLSVDKTESLRLNEEAFDLQKKCASAREQILQTDVENPQAIYDLAKVWMRIGFTFESFGNQKKSNEDFHSALIFHGKTLVLSEKLLAIEPNNPKWQRLNADTYLVRGEPLRLLNKTDEALKSLQVALEKFSDLSRQDPNNLEAKRDVFNAYDRTARIYEQTNDYAKAIENFERAANIMKEIVGNDASSDFEKTVLASFYSRIAELQKKIKQHSQAEENARKAFEWHRIYAATMPENAAVQVSLANYKWRLGKIILERSKPSVNTAARAEALFLLEQSLEEYKTILKKTGGSDADYKWSLAEIEQFIAEAKR